MQGAGVRGRRRKEPGDSTFRHAPPFRNPQSASRNPALPSPFRPRPSPFDMRPRSAKAAFAILSINVLRRPRLFLPDPHPCPPSPPPWPRKPTKSRASIWKCISRRWPAASPAASHPLAPRAAGRRGIRRAVQLDFAGPCLLGIMTTRCSFRQPMASAQSSKSPSRPACTTPSASIWWRCASTTRSAAAPSRCFFSTTWPCRTTIRSC